MADLEELKKASNPIVLLADEMSGLRGELRVSQAIIAKLLGEICEFKLAQKKSDNEKHAISSKLSKLALGVGVINLFLYFDVIDISKGSIASNYAIHLFNYLKDSL